ncbi:MAG: M99 family carboxypeptidase catalytic domain-containing protein [Desulfovibrionaceae bacterium]
MKSLFSTFLFTILCIQFFLPLESGFSYQESPRSAEIPHNKDTSEDSTNSIQKVTSSPEKEKGSIKIPLTKTISKTRDTATSNNKDLSFTLFTFEHPENTNPALLVIAGIQGDEPGAFSAASLLATRYTFYSGALWIVPNLNFPSILSANRGISNDMNRKFDFISKNDPDYLRVKNIKELILDNNVDFVYHMHDGSGFYRPIYLSPQFSPKRWGQCLIIDQTALDPTIPHSNIEQLSSNIITKVNKSVLDTLHIYHLHNTRTKEGNKEMEKSLTWFTIKNGKAAIASEASKNFSLTKRVYYHLLALEALLEERGIEFKRDFPLTTSGVWNALYDVNISLSDSFYLPLKDVRPKLSYIPIKSELLTFSSENPLIHVEQNPKNKKEYIVRYGNRLLTRLSTEQIPFDDSLKELPIIVDGKHSIVPLSSVIPVNKSFFIPSIKGHRLNVIGYTKKGISNEFDILLQKQDLLPQYSIDKKSRTFRVELYKEKTFVGIFYIRFPA